MKTSSQFKFTPEQLIANSPGAAERNPELFGGSKVSLEQSPKPVVGLPKPVVEVKGAGHRKKILESKPGITSIDGHRIPGIEKANKTEIRFAKEILAPDIGKRFVSVVFEGMTIVIGEDQCRYTPDFVAQTSDGVTHLFEVKGTWVMDSAVVRFKAAKRNFPAFVFWWCIWKGNAQGWELSNVSKGSKRKK
jgi:hypothetical protein